MPSFGKKSTMTLQTAHPDLQRVFQEVVKHFDCAVICGCRDRQEQERLFSEGKTKAHFGESPHNHDQSLAVDVVPYPVDWQDTERMILFAGYVLATARSMGIVLKWGGDWDRDTHLADNRFDDFPHFELANWRDL